MKRKLLSILVLFVSIHINALNVAIVESQSYNSGHVNDQAWLQVASAIGHNAAIVDKTFLDTYSSLDATEILIVSSGMNGLTSIQSQTVQQFILSGRPAYIQAEYLPSLPGNVLFKSVMQSVGETFNWVSNFANDLVPMNVLGTLSSTPNTVTTLQYFWYGTSGVGTGVEPFLEYNGSYFGFCYTDTNALKGTVITTSDQDWVLNSTATISNALMENILYKLSLSPALAVKSLNATKDFLIISPNPFSSTTTIQSKANLNGATFTIFNALGQQVKELNNASGTTTILNRDNLQNGVYYIQTSQDNKVIATNKLIITD